MLKSSSNLVGIPWFQGNTFNAGTNNFILLLTSCYLLFAIRSFPRKRRLIYLQTLFSLNGGISAQRHITQPPFNLDLINVTTYELH